MAKFGLIHDRILQTGLATPDQFHQPDFPPVHWLEQVHTPDYVRAYCDGSLDPARQRRIGLPWSAALARRTQIAVAGTVLTAKLALETGLACNTAGGTHHAFPDYGSGFCIFNDLAVAAQVLRSQGLVDRILIVDLDVHQGDGTAWIFRDDPDVFTFSMHCQANFPGTKQKSDRDVPLPVGLEDDDYLRLLADHLPDLLSEVKPDLVLYDAGVDTHRGDRLGKLCLTDTGIFRREMQVLGTCRDHHIPVACVIGGGYADDLMALVDRHILLHRAASQICWQYRC